MSRARRASTTGYGKVCALYETGAPPSWTKQVKRAVSDARLASIAELDTVLAEDQGHLFVLQSFDVAIFAELVAHCYGSAQASAKGKATTSTAHGPSCQHRRTCRVIGLPAFIRCVSQKAQLPSMLESQPVFSVAMRRLTICFTHLDQDKRNELQRLIQLMGGHVTKPLTEDVTHLVTVEQGRASDKFKMCVRRNIPIMDISWVYTSWDSADDQTFYAADTDMLDQHRLKPFAGCVICVTGLSASQRQSIQELTENNGGQFSPSLSQSCTHLLALQPSGQKYEYAVRWSIIIVNPAWHKACVERGVRVDESFYPVNQAKGDLTPMETEVELADSESTFLDGCNVYLHSLEGMRRQFYTRIVRNASGSVREALDGSVTHIVVGKPPEDAQLEVWAEKFPATYVVHTEWLLVGAQTGKQAQHSLFELRPSRLGMPASLPGTSRTNGTAERNGAHKPPTDDWDDVDPSGRDSQSDQRFLEALGLDADVTSDADWQQRLKARRRLFQGMTFEVCPLFSLPTSNRLRRILLIHGATIDEDEATNPAFSLVPLRGWGDQVPNARGVQVTSCWLEQAIHDIALPDVESCFLHKPVQVALPLENMEQHTICYSGFDSPLREHINHCCAICGAEADEVLARTKTTVLICAEASGAKYRKAKKWKIPVVSLDWLRACLEAGRAVEPNLFAIGSSSSLPAISGHLSVPANGAATPSSTRFRPKFKTSPALNALASPGIAQPSPVAAMRSNHGITSNGAILDGVVAGFTPRVKKQEQRECLTLLRKLGASAHTGLTGTETHIVHSGRWSDLSKDIRSLSLDGKKVVSPHWVRACAEQGYRVKEDDYTSSFNPNMSLSVTVRAVQSSQTQPSGMSPPLPLVGSGSDSSARRTTSRQANGEQPLTNSSSSTAVTVDPPAANDDASEAGQTRSSHSRARRKSRAMAGISLDAAQPGDGSFSPRSPEEDADATANPDMGIVYGDPHSEARSRLVASLVVDKPEEVPGLTRRQSSVRARSRRDMDVDAEDDQDERVLQPTDDTTIPTERVTDRPRCFLLTGLSEEDKIRCTQILTNLGAEVLSLPLFDAKATHVIVGQPSRSEKYLAACAAGRWVLHMSYVESCASEGRFVPEQQHEWSRRDSLGKHPHLNEAPHKWRQRISNDPKFSEGAFTGWRVLVCVRREIEDGFRRLLLAGGAQAWLMSDELCDKELSIVTHVLLEPKAASSVKRRLAGMDLPDVPCLRSDYVADYLIKPEFPDTSQYTVPLASKRAASEDRTGHVKRSRYEESDTSSPR